MGVNHERYCPWNKVKRGMYVHLPRVQLAFYDPFCLNCLFHYKQHMPPEIM
jgi:hypothetical protein